MKVSIQPTLSFDHCLQFSYLESTTEDTVHIDIEGVMIDFMEMAIDPEDRALQSIAVRTTPTNGGIRGQQSDVTTLQHPSAVIHVPDSHQQPKAKYKDLEESGWPNTVKKDGSTSDLTEPHHRSGELRRESQSESVAKFLLETTNNTEHSGGRFIGSKNSSSVSGSLTLPVPFATLPLEQLLHQQWVTDLQQILKQLPQGLAPVSIVTADYKFRNVLLNWIVVAKTQANPPLTRIVVFSLDQALCELLKRRRIHCVFVAPSHYLTENTIASLTKHIVFSEVMVLRLTAMRLVNYWGYDAANYDTDAIILKSPESLYLRHADSHMIGSYGHYPGELGRAWGTTVCCGVFMTRSSPFTGMKYELVIAESCNYSAFIVNQLEGVT